MSSLTTVTAPSPPSSRLSFPPHQHCQARSRGHIGPGPLSLARSPLNRLSPAGSPGLASTPLAQLGAQASITPAANARWPSPVQSQPAQTAPTTVQLLPSPLPPATSSCRLIRAQTLNQTVRPLQLHLQIQSFTAAENPSGREESQANPSDKGFACTHPPSPVNSSGSPPPSPTISFALTGLHGQPMHPTSSPPLRCRASSSPSSAIDSPEDLRLHQILGE